MPKPKNRFPRWLNTLKCAIYAQELWHFCHTHLKHSKETTQKPKKPLIFISLILTTLLSGCVPIAWITPPLQIEAGIGPTFVTAEEPDTAPIQAQYDLRVSVPPLTVVPDWMDRPYDFSFGYGLRNTFNNDMLAHGPFASFTLFITDFDTSARLGMQGMLQALATPEYGFFDGGAGGVQFFIEWVEFIHGDRTEGCGPSFCGISAGYGETSIGFFAEFQHQRLSGRSSSAAIFGLKARIPVSMGLGLVAFR